MSKKRQIMLCFVRSDSAVLQESWLNSAASYLAPRNPRNGSPYIHVEILFVPKNNKLRNKLKFIQQDIFKMKSSLTV